MKCTTCGTSVEGKPIREQIGGMIHYYCSPDCFRRELLSRDKLLKRRFRNRGQRLRTENRNPGA